MTITSPLKQHLTPYALWVGRRYLPGDADGLAAVGARLDELGVGALWLGGSPPGDLLVPDGLLAGSERLVVGTSIVNVWTETEAEVAASSNRLTAAYGDRFVLGLGTGHAPTAESTGQAYVKPLGRLRGFLEGLDAQDPPVAPQTRVLASLGPKALELAAQSSAGVVPYLTTPEHTKQAREALGEGGLVIPEHKVVLVDDRAEGLAVGRKMLATYLVLPNYVNSWRRLGFGDDDFADGGSERLVDAVITIGDVDQALAAAREHLDAGADQVALQVLPAGDQTHDELWARLAGGFTA